MIPAPAKKPTAGFNPASLMSDPSAVLGGLSGLGGAPSASSSAFSSASSSVMNTFSTGDFSLSTGGSSSEKSALWTALFSTLALVGGAFIGWRFFK